jgi:hypothetical protein
MIRHDFTVEIKAPLEKVFAFTTDFTNFVKWQDGISQASQSPEGPTRAGTTFTLTRTFLGQRIEAAGNVTEFVPNARCTFKTTAGPMQLSVVQSYESIPAGTRLTLHLEAEPGGFFKLAEGAMERQITAAFDSQVQKLKSLLES